MAQRNAVDAADFECYREFGRAWHFEFPYWDSFFDTRDPPAGSRKIFFVGSM